MGDIAPETSETPAESTEVIEEAKEEKKQEEAAQELGTDDLEERIANRVYDKVKSFFGEMVKSADDLNQLVSESVATKVEEMTPAEEEAEEVEPAADTKPARSHRLFSRPGRKRE